MRFVIMAAVLAAGTCPAEVLFSDDFEDGVADGWTELPTGASYYVSEGWYVLEFAAADEVTAGTYSGDTGSGMSVADYSILLEVTPRAGTGGPWARLGTGSMTGYTLLLDPESDLVAILKCNAAGDPEVLSATTEDLHYNQPYWVRFEVCGDLLGGKVWTGPSSLEPSTWLLMANDVAYADAGWVCLFSHDSDPGGEASLDFMFDNVEVSDDLTLELSAGTWASIKAAF